MKVQIEYCTNCSEHSWCSHHDETKYKLYFQKIKTAIYKSLRQGQYIEIIQMQPKQHFRKKYNLQTDNKYIDERTGEQFHFPRIGAFEVYVNCNLIFSKLRSNSWPNIQSIAEIVTNIYNSQQRQTKLEHYVKQGQNTSFRISSSKRNQSRHSSTSKKYRKRQISRQAQQIQIEGMYMPHQPTKKLINSDQVIDEVDLLNETQPKNFLLMGNKHKARKNNLANRLDYKEIYTSAAHDMKQYKRKIESLQKQLDETKKKKRIVYPQVMRSEQKPKSRTVVVNRYNQTAGGKKRPEDYISRNRRNVRNMIDSHRKSEQEDQQWSLSDLINQYQKGNSTKHQKNNSQAVKVDRIAKQKKKYETIIQKLRDDQKSYEEKLQKINKRLGIDNNSLVKQKPSLKNTIQISKQLNSSKKQGVQIALPKILSESTQKKQENKKVESSIKFNAVNLASIDTQSGKKPEKVSQFNQSPNKRKKSQTKQQLEQRLKSIEIQQKYILQKLQFNRPKKNLEYQKQLQKQLQKERQLNIQRQKQQERLNSLELQKYKAKIIQMQKQREKQKQLQSQRAKIAQMQKEKLKQQQFQKEKNKVKSINQSQKNTQKQLKERQVLMNIERQKEKMRQMQRQRQIQKQKQLEKQRQSFKERQLAREKERQAQKEEIQRLKKRQAQLQKQRQQQIEKQRLDQIQKQKQIQRLKQAQKERQKQIQKQRQTQLNKQKQLEKQLERYKLIEIFQKDNLLANKKQAKVSNRLDHWDQQNLQQEQELQRSLGYEKVSIFDQKDKDKSSERPKSLQKQKRQQKDQQNVIETKKSQKSLSIKQVVEVNYNQISNKQQVSQVKSNQKGQTNTPTKQVVTERKDILSQKVSQRKESKVEDESPVLKTLEKKSSDAQLKRKNNFSQRSEQKISNNLSNSRQKDSLSKSKPQKLPSIPVELIKNLRKQRHTPQARNYVNNANKSQNQSSGNQKNQSFRSNQSRQVHQQNMPIPQLIISQRQKRKNLNLNLNLNKQENNKASSYGQKDVSMDYIKQFPKIKLHINKNIKNNPYLENFKIEKNKIEKIQGDGSWHCVKCQQILPNCGKYSIDFEIVKSKWNCVEVGFMPRDYHCIQNRICDKAIGLNIANGKLHDSCGDRNRVSTKWRQAFQPLQQNEKILIEMCIDFDSQLIRWRLNRQQFAQSVISNYLKEMKCVAYFTMVHIQDIVVISPKQTNFQYKQRVVLASESNNNESLKKNGDKPQQDELRYIKNLSRIQQDDKQYNDNESNPINSARKLQSRLSNEMQPQKQEKQPDVEQPLQKIQQKQQKPTLPDTSLIKLIKVQQQESVNDDHNSSHKDQKLNSNNLKGQINQQKTDQNIDVKHNQPKINQKLGNSPQKQQLNPNSQKVDLRVQNQESKQTSQHQKIDQDINSNPNLAYTPLKVQNASIIQNNLPNIIQQSPLILQKLSILKDDETNPFDFLYSIEQNSIRKVQGDNFWHTLKFQQILPNEGQYGLTFNIQKSKERLVEIGIIPYNYTPIANKLCDRSIGLHIGNAKIHDTNGDKAKKSTKWRQINGTYKQAQKLFVQMEIDADAQTIQWKINNDLVAQSVITDYLKNKQFVAYCSLVNINDEVSFNLPLVQSPKAGQSSVLTDNNYAKTQNQAKKAQEISIDPPQKLQNNTGSIQNSNPIQSIHQKEPNNPKQQVQKQTKVGSMQKNQQNLNENKAVPNQVFVSHQKPSSQIKTKQNPNIVILNPNNTQKAEEKIISNQNVPVNSVISNQQSQKVDTKQQKTQKVESLPQQNVAENLRESIIAYNQDNLNRIIYQNIDTNLQKNPFQSFFSIEKNIIKKTSGNQIWHILKSAQVLPNQGKFTLTYKILNTKSNCIQFGIIPKDFIPIANKTCNKSIGLHVANGKVHDTDGDRQKKGTNWRVVCSPIKAGQVSNIQLKVDATAGTIRWKKDGQSFAQSVLTNYLREHQYVAYVSFLNVDDVVEINVPKYTGKKKTSRNIDQSKPQIIQTVTIETQLIKNIEQAVLITEQRQQIKNNVQNT